MAPHLFDLSGKVAVVTGGNGGIGLGMARGFAACGATVAIVGRNADKSAAAVKAIKNDGGKACAQPAMAAVTMRSTTCGVRGSRWTTTSAA